METLKIVVDGRDTYIYSEMYLVDLYKRDIAEDMVSGNNDKNGFFCPSCQKQLDPDIYYVYNDTQEKEMFCYRCGKRIRLVE